MKLSAHTPLWWCLWDSDMHAKFDASIVDFVPCLKAVGIFWNIA